MAALFLSLLLVTVAVVLCNVRFGLSKLETIKHPSSNGGGHQLGFLVIGDWGRRGGFNQSQVAIQMGRVGAAEVDFIISTGDNFYEDGLTGEEDPAFEESFTQIYTAPTLQKPWYSVLGNHDYRGDAEAQLSPFLRKVDPRWICLRSFIVDAEIAEIFFVDTTPFVDLYFTDTKDHTYDWRGIPSRNAYVSGLLKDLDSALQRSTAKWKIVVGHHAIRSVGHHGDTLELRDQLLPILRSNNVDFYLNGHDHCLEHISDKNSPIQFLTSGAGSKAWRGDTEGVDQDDVKFFYDGQGFMSMQVNQWEVKVAFYDIDGQILHTWVTSKQHQMAS